MTRVVLDQRVIVEAETASEDPGGGQATAWVFVAEVWASVVPLSGRETVSADQLQARVSHRVTIRNRRGVAATHRLKWNGTILNIRSAADPGPRALYRDLLCEEGGPT